MGRRVPLSLNVQNSALYTEVRLLEHPHCRAKRADLTETCCEAVTTQRDSREDEVSRRQFPNTGIPLPVEVLFILIVTFKIQQARILLNYLTPELSPPLLHTVTV